MLKMKNVLILTLLSLSINSSFAFSSGMSSGRIHFMGRIVADPCVVEADGSVLNTYCPGSPNLNKKQSNIDLTKVSTFDTPYYDVKKTELSDTANLLVITYK